MSYQYIRVERNAGVTAVTLNRPEVMNALHAPMHLELQAAFDDFSADPAQLICVVNGAGERAFCAGSDLKSQAQAGPRVSYPRSGYAGLTERFDLSKPLIAAVDGVCLGGGFEIALACDLIVASEDATFGLPEPRVGAIALGGGIHRLARQIGLKRAMGFILTGKPMSAQEAFALGLVNEITAKSQLSSVVARWCEEILRAAPLAVQASKEVAQRGLDEPSLSAALQRQTGYEGYQRWIESQDLREGALAFAEKRLPRWTGS